MRNCSTSRAHLPLPIRTARPGSRVPRSNHTCPAVEQRQDFVRRCRREADIHLAQAADKAGRRRDLLARNGIDCPTVTRAGTGSFEFEAPSGVYTELNEGWTIVTGDLGGLILQNGRKRVSC
jgi:hypothetical protein